MIKLPMAVRGASAIVSGIDLVNGDNLRLSKTNALIHVIGGWDNISNRCSNHWIIPVSEFFLEIAPIICYFIRESKCTFISEIVTLIIKFYGSSFKSV